MPFPDHPEKENTAKPFDNFSVSEFFHEAYQHPLTAIAERPREAIAAAALIGAAAAAAIYSRRALAGMLRNGEETIANLDLPVIQKSAATSWGEAVKSPMKAVSHETYKHTSFRFGATEAERAEGLLDTALSDSLMHVPFKLGASDSDKAEALLKAATGSGVTSPLEAVPPGVPSFANLWKAGISHDYKIATSSKQELRCTSFSRQ